MTCNCKPQAIAICAGVAKLQVALALPSAHLHVDAMKAQNVQHQGCRWALFLSGPPCMHSPTTPWCCFLMSFWCEQCQEKLRTMQVQNSGFCWVVGSWYAEQCRSCYVAQTFVGLIASSWPCQAKATLALCSSIMFYHVHCCLNPRIFLPDGLTTDKFQHMGSIVCPMLQSR